MSSFGIVFILSVLFNIVNSKSLELPPYVTACSRNEPDFNACALKSARAALPHFINGNRKYRTPPLDPMEITEIILKEGILGLKMTAKNLKFHGLRSTVIKNTLFDLKKQTVAYMLLFPRLETNIDYTVDGRILILPITGAGPGNITFVNLHANYTYDYILEKKDGHRYMSIRNNKLTYKMSRLYVKLENLFNGNKLIGDQMNAFMDENWRELVTDIGPIVGESLNEVMTTILQSMFSLVSFDKAIPDTPVS